jgi:hypothetical protein
MAKAATATKPAAAKAPAAPASTPKSIVNPKYRGKYTAENKDWLAKLLDAEASKTKDVKVTKPNPENPDEKITVTEKRPDGVDTDALFTIAANNGLDVAKYKAQVDGHGFPGRFRMTVGNMLRKVVKQRHGVFNKGKTFMSAPPEMLAKLGVTGEPTHTQAGEKIAKPVAAKAEAPAADAAKTEAAKPAAKKK